MKTEQTKMNKLEKDLIKVIAILHKAQVKKGQDLTVLAGLRSEIIRQAYKLNQPYIAEINDKLKVIKL